MKITIIVEPDGPIPLRAIGACAQALREYIAAQQVSNQNSPRSTDENTNPSYGESFPGRSKREKPASSHSKAKPSSPSSPVKSSFRH
jgi:hypothetical protein